MMKALKTSSILLLVLFMGSTLCWAAGSEEKAVEKPVVEKTGPVVDEWVLPCVTQLTGPFAAFFEQGVFAMKEAQKEINAAGGILGRPLRIMFYDEGPDPTTASPVVAKVLDTKPIAILGPGVGDNARATVPMIKKEGMMATPVATGVGAVLDWVEPESWVLQFLDFDERTAKPGVMEWIRREPEIKKVVQFVFPKYELYISYAQLQKEALESMGVEVVMIDVTEEQVNLAPIAVQALSYKPDGFLMTILSVPCAKLIIELDKRGVKDKSTICMFGTVDDPQLYETGKGYLDGAYMWTYFDEFKKVADCPSGSFPAHIRFMDVL
jgi:branched-chain amino acid transport system substrate-binding protein